MDREDRRPILDLPPALAEQLDKCLHCGQCRPVCPVFQHTRQEKYTARGRIALIQAVAGGELPAGPGFFQTLDNCLLCMACVEACAGGVLTERVVKESRAAWLAQNRPGLAKRLLCRGLAQGEAALSVAATAQKLFFQAIPGDSGLRRRFPLPGVDRDQWVPQLTDRPFRARPRKAAPATGGGERVIFFTGCMANYVSPRLAEATVAVLEALGIEVVVPPEQGCCGAPHDACGDTETARRLARRNLAALAGADPVVVPCATCGLTLRRGYPALLAGHEPDQRAAQDLASRVMDISAYLIRRVGPERLGALISRPLDRRLTYHDPCHLAKGQGVRAEPRQLLGLAVGDGYVESAGSESCCGLAGSYALGQRELSRRIQTDKMADIRATGADLVASGCPACLLQLRDGARRHDLPTTPLHTVEVLAMAMGLLEPPPAPTPGA